MFTDYTIHRRTYGAALERAPLRSPTAERPLTPAEELAPWLQDEVCIACGAPAGTRQLYCSNACRDGDQQQRLLINTITPGSPSNGNLASQVTVPSTSHSPPPPASRDHAPLSPLTQGVLPNALNTCSLASEAFRYPCPTSPQLFAQRKAMAQKAPQQTSGAFGRSLAALRTLGLPARHSGTPSSGEEPEAARQRRGSSASSTCSSESSSAVLTDPSTPSPAYGPTSSGGRKARGGALSDVDVDADLDGSDFRLPPSVTPAPCAVMRHQPQQGWMHSRRTSSIASGPTAAAAPHRNSHHPTMSYARRPSSTNVSAPILYSPALSANAAMASPVLQAERARASMTPVRRPTRNCGGSGSESQQRAMSRGKDSSTLPEHRGEAVSKNQEGRIAIPAPTNAQASSAGSRTDLDPMSQGFASRHASPSSSGTKTLIPARSSGSSPHATSRVDVCGRPGCSGPSTSHRAVTCSSSSKLDRPPLRLADESLPSRSKSRHRHTHSAQAGLTIHPSFGAAAMEGLLMTSVKSSPMVSQAGGTFSLLDRCSACRSPDPGHTKSLRQSSPPTVAMSRGRSQARGRRSTSKRSRSPPRAAARGRSQALHMEETLRKKTSATSPPLEAVKPGSQPITIVRRGSSCTRSSSAASQSSEAAEYLVDESCGSSSRPGRRGRSPVERSETLPHLDAKVSCGSALVEVPQNRLTIRHGVQYISDHGKTVDLAKLELEDKDGEVEEGDRPLSLSPPVVDPGFDVVEDLDIES